MQILALETLGEAQSFRCLTCLRGGFEDHLAGLAITDFDRIHDAGAGVRRDRQPIYEHKYGLREINIEQRLGRGELEDLPILVETVESAGAEIE